jgi:hypothetical protein
MSGIAQKQNAFKLKIAPSFNLMRRKIDVTFAANPEISNLKQNNKKSKRVVIPFLIQM